MLKFDGYRVQLHKAEQTAALFGKYGGDFTQLGPNGRRGGPCGARALLMIRGELTAASGQR